MMPRRQLAFIAILIVTLLAAMDQTIVVTALPRIVGDLGGFDSFSWVMSAYLLASTVTIPLYGKLSDLYGRKALFLVAIGLFLVGSLLCGMADSMEALILFRALKGLGAGGLIPLTHAAIGDLFSPRERGHYHGYIAAMWGIAALGGPLLGGMLSEWLSWRWIFYINVPLGLVALLMVIKALPGRRSERCPRVDYAGAIVLGGSISAVLLACTRAGASVPLGSWQVGGLFFAGVAGLALFIVIERRATEPIIPLELFRDRAFLVGCGALFVVGAVSVSVPTFIPMYLQAVRGMSPTLAGAILIAFAGAWPVASFCTGRLVARTGRYRIFPIIGASLATVGVALMALLGASTGLVIVCLVLALGGFGMGMIQSPFLIGVQNIIDPKYFGTASGAINLSRAIGGSVAISLLGVLLSSRATAHLRDALGPASDGINIDAVIAGESSVNAQATAAVSDALMSGLQLVYVAVAAISIIGIVCAWALPERPLSTQVPGEK